MKSQITNLIGFVIVALAFAGVIFYGINTFRALHVKEISAQIDFQCAQTYRYTETLKSGVVVSYPMQKEYDDCVKAKGNLN